MDSNKAVFYYFCLVVVFVMLAVALMVEGIEIAIPGNPEGAWRIVSRCLIGAAVFSFPPILWKIFVREEPKEKNRSNFGWCLLWGVAWFIVVGLASAMAMAGMIKAATWTYIGSLFPAAMFFMPVVGFFSSYRPSDDAD